MHFLFEKVIKNGSSSESYLDFDDEPQAGQMPEQEPPKKKGFSWGSLLVAAVAVVAVAVSVATFGVAVGALISVASTAIGDAISGKRSSLGTYIKNALVGAVSGAIFGPFGAFESLGGMLAFGGVTGMADSLLNQAIEGEFSFGQTLFDGAIGVATAGLLHGAGKALKGTSKYVKNAVNKVISKNESALMNIAKKLDDVFAPVRVATTPDGMTIPMKEETTRIQDAVSKIVEDAKSGGNKGASEVINEVSEAATKPSLAKGGKPKGNYEKPDVNEPGPITRQNEAADLLANKGYNIEMLPNKIDGNGYGIDPTKSPDFLIEGNPFDCYSPSTNNIRNIWKTIADKSETQASRIILNLDDYSGSMDALKKQFNDWSIDTLEELIIIKDGQIFTWINK